MSLVTFDAFFDGRIQVRQESDGYRYSIDAVILAYFSKRLPGEKVLDLGTGCGIIPLIMAFRKPAIHVFGVEVQSSLARLAVENVKDNRMTDRITILHADMKSLRIFMTGGPVDLVVVNPPFHRAGSGRINPNDQRAVARHEIRVGLSDVMLTARRMLRTGGYFLSIYTAERVCDLIIEMRKAGIEPKTLQAIQSYENEAAKLVLVEGKKGGKPGTRLAPPIILYHTDGAYTEAARQMFQYD
ncbi:MAG: tRNA1(Val) (adenine(37)-N6)-methyltransferase [Desulfobacterales bacterium]|nr:tRNA1(Val) (adenine(37)-N6)-methyltransferase [Desulfobacterales bacterium]